MDTLTLFLHLPAPWGAEDTDTLLDILKKNDVKATFFLCGYWVDKYPEEVKKIYNDGHDIGNHSNTHPHGSKLSLEENKENIQGCHEKIKNLLGIDANLYRPPFGEYNDTVLDAAKACGYYAIQWDVELLETKYTQKMGVSVRPFNMYTVLINIDLIYKCFSNISFCFYIPTIPTVKVWNFQLNIFSDIKFIYFVKCLFFLVI